MKRVLPLILFLAIPLAGTFAGTGEDSLQLKSLRKLALLREAPVLRPSLLKSSRDEEETFKPSIQVGSIVHMFYSSQQKGFMSPNAADASAWSKNFNIYRARILVGGQLSKNGSFFLETEIPSIIGTRIDDESKNVKVAPVLLDVQYEHKIAANHMVVAGMQLVSHNRNGLQGAASLMANDFTYFQYPYNLFENSPLQGNFGRDVGVNMRGFFLQDKLEYRLGVFSGRRFDDESPFRYVGRVVYNFLEPEKDYYYAGTKLGAGKTIALGAGFDKQSTYSSVGADLFVDVPAGQLGSVTLNAAFARLTGGNNIEKKYTFAGLIPTQTTQFLELGYYFTGVKLQPWIRYEKQAFASETNQTEGMPTGAFDDQNSVTVFGGGLNYFFNGYGTNVRLSYTTWSQKDDTMASKTSGQIWLQLQFFLF